ncbi:hypothetical protein Tco_0782258, partial [Tanacetum coccineum]
VAVCSSLRLLKPKRTIESRAKRSSVNLVRTHIQLSCLSHTVETIVLPEHPSETIVFHNEDGNPARANIKQALGYLKDGDGDGNSYAQDGDPSQDDVRLCLGDDLKKAQDHSQRQA